MSKKKKLSKRMAAKYDITISEVFTRLHGRSPSSNQLDFDKKLIEQVIDELVGNHTLASPIKNVPDIKYTYDARKDFPNLISSTGHWAIIGRGKSRYSFVVLHQPNLIRTPRDLPTPPQTIAVKDLTPPSVSAVIGEDEQATLTRVRYSDVIGAVLHMKAHHVQSHHRTTVSSGQIEVDEIYVAEHPDGKRFVVPVSAKGGGDCLSYSQAHNLVLYASEKKAYNGLAPLPLGLVRLGDGTLAVVEFDPGVRIQDIRITRAVVVALTS